MGLYLYRCMPTRDLSVKIIQSPGLKQLSSVISLMHNVGFAGQCSQVRPVEDHFGNCLKWGSRPLRGASRVGADRGCSRCGRAFGLIWTEDPPPCFVLAGAVGGSVVGWMLTALQSYLMLLVGLCAGCEGLPWPLL
jgi:hypothetical protein